MAAYSNDFPWPSYYRHYNFFEHRMRAHSRVRELETLGEGLYRISLRDGRDLDVFICECYSFGVAEYTVTTERLGIQHAIIINSNWCGYTDDLKLQCRNERVGLFSITEFMAALNRKDYWNYLTEEQAKRFK